MELREREQSTAEILKAVAAERQWASVEQFERWRQAGLIPAARRISRGGRSGTNWLHPSGTAERVRALMRLRPRAIGLAETAIRLWLAGFDLDEVVVRQALRHIIDRHRKTRARVSPGRDAERFGDELARSARTRRRWGVTSTATETGVLLAIESVMRGMVENRPLDRGEADIVSELYTRDDAERDALRAFTPDFAGEVIAAFDVVRIAPDVVDEASWAELNIARIAVPQFAEFVRQMAAAPPGVVRDLCANYRRSPSRHPRSSC